METITHAKLIKTYGRGAYQVLRNHLSQMPRKKKEHRKYEIIKPLPAVDSDEYQNDRKKTFTTTVESLVSEAFSIVEELASEMREICDNTPENLQQTDVYQRREEAADALEYIEQPEIPEDFLELEIFYIPSENSSSRRDRASEAEGMLREAAEALRDKAEELRETHGESEVDEPETQVENEQADEIDEAAQRIDEAADAICDVEFPGMFG